MSEKYKIHQTDGGLGFINTIGISSPLTAEQKLAEIRRALDHCNAQHPAYSMDAVYDFRATVEGILGEK